MQMADKIVLRSVESLIPYARTARMLMAVAKDLVLSKRDHGHVLPPAWRTLYEFPLRARQGASLPTPYRT